MKSLTPENFNFFVPVILFAGTILCFAEKNLNDGEIEIVCGTGTANVFELNPETGEKTVKFAIFNDKKAETVTLRINVKQRPIPHKEFIICDKCCDQHSWDEIKDGKISTSANGDVLTIKIDQPNDLWGNQYKFTAKTTFYEISDSIKNHKGPHQFRSKVSAEKEVIAPKIEIKSISFNHTPGDSTNDAIDLRESFDGNDIVAPEWKSGETTAKPVAYRGGILPNVKVELSVLPQKFEDIVIGAEESVSSGKTKFFVGGVPEKTVILSQEKDSIIEDFPMASEIDLMIDKKNVTWTWEAKSLQETDIFGWEWPVEIPVYVTLDSPKLPWKEKNGGTQKLWVSALDFAIEKCETRGKTDDVSCLSQLTKFLYHHKKYQKKSTCYYVEDENYEIFNYTKFFNEALANCEDHVFGLTASANLLGIAIDPIKHFKIFGYKFHCYGLYFEETVFDSCLYSEPFSIKEYLEKANPKDDAFSFFFIIDEFR